MLPRVRGDLCDGPGQRPRTAAKARRVPRAAVNGGSSGGARQRHRTASEERRLERERDGDRVETPGCGTGMSCGRAQLTGPALIGMSCAAHRPCAHGNELRSSPALRS